jgi:hypothetical protein
VLTEDQCDVAILGWAHFRQGRADVDTALAGAPDVRTSVRWLPLGNPTDV